MQPGLEVLRPRGGMDLVIHLSPLAIIRLVVILGCYHVSSPHSFEPPALASTIDFLLPDASSLLLDRSDSALLLAVLVVLSRGVVLSTFHL